MTDQDRQQVIALAAVFQAALLADEVARTGLLPAESASPLLDAVLDLDPNDFDAVYPDPVALAPGLALLDAALNGGEGQNSRAIAHALSLVQLANIARRDSALLNVLRNRLLALSALPEATDRSQQTGLCRLLAGVYVDTFGSLRFRIRVQGDPANLQQEDNAARIRALFLAGVRAAFLWQQSGGRRWHMLFSRRRLGEAVRALRPASH